jgi:hypothetical protein
MRCFAILMLMALWVTAAAAQERQRPGLFFREDWAESPAQLPVTQQHVANPALLLSLHGPGRDGIKKSNHERPYDDPFYIWNGDAKANWALSLRHRDAQVDLSNQARIVWRSKQQGLHWLRIVLKLADGTWLVSEAADGPSSDWRITEFVLADTKWFRLNIDEVLVGALVARPDLSRVEEIGFTDLMRGGNTPSSSRLDWIEVYGYPVARATAP